MSKIKTFDPRKTKQCQWIINFFKKHDRPLSHNEILSHTATWKHGMTSNQLANILKKSTFFEFAGHTTMYGNARSGPYKVNLYTLSDRVDEGELLDIPKCITCSNPLVRSEKRKCKKCYLAWKREERAKRGEA
tara:strand:+ start:250 stop:648 length:399 start_codon:yes stop_codon:yes gene_type:complete